MTFNDELRTTRGTSTEEESEYPVIFGLTVTPVVGGIIAGVTGVLAAFYLWNNLVNPIVTQKAQLETDLENKQAQLNQLKSGEAERTIQNLEAELARELELEPQVLSMFSDERTLDTLLLDLNNIIQSNQVELVNYQPQDQTEIISDGSLGTLVDGRLKRKVITLTIQGTFPETLKVIQDIERLQPLLLIKDFSTNVVESPEYSYSDGQLTVTGTTKLNSSFKIEAILPLSPEEIPPPPEVVPAEGAPAEGPPQ